MKPNTNKKDTLFKLIKAMHKGEKRFFAQYCTHYGGEKDKVYLQLFKILDKQTVYDEEALRKKLKDTSYIGHLHVVKNYLNNLILDSLYFYRNRNSKGLRTVLLRAETYFEKGLYDAAEQALQKIRKEAEDQEDFISLFEIIRLEKRLMLIRFKIDEEKLKPILEKEKICFDSYKEVSDHTNLALDVAYMHFKYFHSGQNKKEIEEREVDQSSIFKGIPAPHTTHANYLLHNVRGTYFRTIGDHVQASMECGLALEVLENDKAFNDSHPEMIFGALLNYITSMLILGQYKRAAATAKRVRSFVAGNLSKFNENLVIKYLVMEQMISLRIGEKDETIQLLENIEQYMATHKNISDIDTITFYFYSVDTYQVYNDYNKAMYWLNKALNHTRAENINVSIHYYMRIQEVILLFEMKEYELMRYRLRSLYRYQAGRSSGSTYEKVLMEFFRTLFKKSILDNLALKQLFISLKDSLEKVFEDKNEATALDYFDTLSWIKSRIENRPLGDVIKDKYLNAE